MINHRNLCVAAALPTLLAGCGVESPDLDVADQAVAAGLPETIATGQDGPFSVVVDAARAYWFAGSGTPDNTSSINATAKTGGGPVSVLASGIADFGFMRIDQDRLYWPTGAVTPHVGGVQSIPKQGGSINNVVKELRVFHIVLSPSHVFLATPDDGGQIKSVTKVGGVETILATNVGPGLDNIPLMALSGNRVLFTQSTFEVDCDGQVRYVPTTGGPIVTLASNICHLTGLAADAGSVYWAEYDADHNRGRLMSLSLTPGATPVVRDQIAAQPFFIEVDASAIYYTAVDGPSGLIRQVSKHPAGINVTLAPDEALPFSLAIDSTHVYWTTILGGEVRRVRKN